MPPICVHRVRKIGGMSCRPLTPPTADSPLAEGWSATFEAFRERIESCLLHDALAELWEFVGGANKVVDAERPWELAKAWKAGDEPAGERLRGVLGDLIEACRLLGLAGAPFLPATAPRILAQLGHRYPYAPDGNGVFRNSGLTVGALNDAGQVVFAAQLVGTSNGSTDNSGLFRGDGATLAQIVRTGQNLPAGASGTFYLLGSPALNSAGEVAFPAFLTSE